MGCMTRARAARSAVGFASLALVLAGCGPSVASCVGIAARIPTHAAPGDTLRIEITDAWGSCNDQGHGPAPEPLDHVRLDLVTVDTAETVIATASGPVSDDATAVVELAVPDDGAGWLNVVGDGVVLGTLSVDR